MRAAVGVAMALLSIAGPGCAGYQRTTGATKSIWSVRVTTQTEQVKNCRRIGTVDATDPARGCGLTVQPTTEECLRFQVSYLGGDTLLSKGFVGEAYDCSGAMAAAPPPAALSPTPISQATAPPPPAPPTLAPKPTPTPQATKAPAPASTPTPSARVRMVQSREEVKGCVYLDEIDLKAECPEEKTSTDCLFARARKAGGDTVLPEDLRARIFSCESRR